MPPPVSDHPTDTALAAFALGRLDPAAAATVARHLDTCTACRATIAQAPADTRAGLPQGAATPGPAAVVPPEPPPELRDHPRYRVIERLGAGGMGVVYRAEHKMMERPVVIKVVSRALVDS